ncbi:hypothetical protein NOR_04892 [Metarhizium rileyi]|uniref:Aminoglycoside phosphotransferase domain-containing protein n=1 Tax=Metarhizium rileyi (strain RCEF 4871) TaxID=1649241 RepID=A0A167DRG7_METRR|nr:hypothetical protein NOR_04892 [Metarhizium rileyi RCEF 4871]
MASSATRQLLRGSVTLDDAISGDDNILRKLQYPEQKQRFWTSLADLDAPGNSDEKLRTEIATYVWLEENCPDVPIPTLHAFGFPDGSMFTHPENTPSITHTLWQARKWMLHLLGWSAPSRYVRRTRQNPLQDGYLILSQAEGTMLSLSWEKHRHDKSYRERLFHHLANITLSINRSPLSRIASLTMQSDGCITLSNRPLGLHFQMLENEGIISGIPRQRSYAAVESYISDLISLQDNKILHQPNAIHDWDDGKGQLAALTALRAVMHTFIRPEYRHGPFFLTLTDLHQSNIFVDEQWNIKAIIDLEWAHAKPIEMQVPPYWLTSRAADGFNDADAIAEYDAILEEYLAIYAEEERRRNGVVVEAPIKRHVWKSGSFWYFHAVSIPKGMFNLFNRHIQPLFNTEHPDVSIFDEVFFWYWGARARETITAKLGDKEDYVDRVRRAFGHSTESSEAIALPSGQDDAEIIVSDKELQL